ncbi:MAG: transglycosylase SLT domain-containing protein [Deltaproteobacteria bacterium]|nr:transglycosylase SLT domain-containing protein [Deltaproteobacteria bacterium]
MRRRLVFSIALMLACSGEHPSHAGAPSGQPKRTPPRPEVGLEPLFSEGPLARAIAHVAKEEWQAARELLIAHLDEKRAPQDETTKARVNFLLATCDSNLSRWRQAASGFDQVPRALPLLADHAYFGAARAYYFLHELESAEDRARKVASDSLLADERRLLLGDIQRAKGDWASVEALYREHLASSPLRRAEARFRLAEALEKLGRGVPGALSLYRELQIDAPLEAWARRAKERFDVLITQVPEQERASYRELTAAEYIRRGMVYFDAMRNPESEVDFASALTAKGLDADTECVARYHRAQSVFKQRQRARSAPLFDEATSACARTKNADLQVRSAYQAGRGWMNDPSPDAIQQAIARFDRAEKWHPDHTFADDARLRQAEAWAELEKKQVPGAADKITELLSTLPATYPEGDMRAEALWRLAWRAFRAGRYDEAISWLDKQVAAVPHDDNYYAEGQAQYWKGRALAMQGKRAEAEEAYEACIREYPLSYYSLHALNRLREMNAPQFEKLIAELKKPPAGNGEPSSSPKASVVLDQPGHGRAIELLRLGLGSQAERELARLGLKVPPGKKKVTDPLQLEKLRFTALLFDRAGRYDKSHWILRWFVLGYKRAWPTDANRALWEVAYPKGYWHVLEPAAKAQGYEPELLISFVREESAFDPVRESFANAIGLTQMIFPTARRFGKGLGFPITRENLRDPDKNAAIGSRFLSFLIKHYGGALGLVVPAYNAGEGAVGRWLCERGDHALDEFAEAIPFDETRNYSKRVLNTYFVYSYLRDGTVPTLPNVIPKGVIPKKCAAAPR